LQLVFLPASPRTPAKGEMIMLAEVLDANRSVLQFVSHERQVEAEGPVTLVERIARAPVRSIGAKEHVFTQGDHRSHLYRVEAGAICLYKVLSDGRRQVIGFAYPGDWLGLGPAGAHKHNAQTTRPSRLRCLPWKSIECAARQNPALGMTIWELMAQELTGAQNLLLTIGQRTATERVAAFLVELSRRNARRGENARLIALPMTRTDMGDLLGLTIETVSRILSQLRRGKIIELAQSSRVQILDVEALMRLATGGKDQ
jgi:CRP-like cAMP-binding protein